RPERTDDTGRKARRRETLAVRETSYVVRAEVVSWERRRHCIRQFHDAKLGSQLVEGRRRADIEAADPGATERREVSADAERGAEVTRQRAYVGAGGTA